MDQRTQNFHFPVSEIPVFHDSGDTDQLVDRRISRLGRGAKFGTFASGAAHYGINRAVTPQNVGAFEIRTLDQFY